MFTHGIDQSLPLGIGQGRRFHGSALHAARFNTFKKRVAHRGWAVSKTYLVDWVTVITLGLNCPPGCQAKAGRCYAHRFQQRPVRDVTWMPIKVIQNTVARIGAMHPDQVVVHKLEAPWLCVVSAGCPARQVENFGKSVAAHVFSLSVGSRAQCKFLHIEGAHGRLHHL